MDVKVSVIIPIYNAENYIGKCLDTIIGQTLREIEIICVNDESTDSTPAILQAYAEKDARIRVVNQKNGGAGAARNHGLRYASGEYLAIVDADDFYELTMLEEAYREAKRTDADMQVFSCDMYDDKTGKYASGAWAVKEKLFPDHMPFAASDVPKDIFKVFVGWSWDKLIRKTLVDTWNLRFQEQRTTNDMLFVFCAVLQSQRINVLQKVLAHHRKEAGSLSVTREKSWHCFHDALTALRDQMKEWGLYERYEQDYINYCIHASLWNLDTLAEPTYTLLYNKLREEWFEEFGVTAHDADYFYNRHEYLRYRKIMEYTADEHLKLRDKLAAEQKEDRSLLATGIQCLKDNGLAYTVKRGLRKILK